MQSFPSFPQRSLTSQGVLYRPLQDVEIYVEDEGSEVFYHELLSRLVGPEIRIYKVIPLRGRKNVLLECEAHEGEHPALFIIDGDLSWVSGEPQPNHPDLFVNPCYCIENYLICEQAMLEVAYESNGKLPRETVEKALDWPSVVAEAKDSLVGLFCEFAAAHLLAPTVKTTAYGLNSICTQLQRKKGPALDKTKARELLEKVRAQILAIAEPEVYRSTRENIAARVCSLPDPLDVVSGKDFLLPLAMFSIRRIASGALERDSLALRLAKHCLLHKLEPLRAAIVEIVSRAKSVPNQALQRIASSACALPATR